MIAHVILFSPKTALAESARQSLVAGLSAAAASIPTIRRFRVGTRVTHGLPGYEQMMGDGFEFAAIIEFDDLDGLKAYLTHPTHLAIGDHFTSSAARSLAYDYEFMDLPIGR